MLTISNTPSNGCSRCDGGGSSSSNTWPWKKEQQQQEKGQDTGANEPSADAMAVLLLKLLDEEPGLGWH